MSASGQSFVHPGVTCLTFGQQGMSPFIAAVSSESDCISMPVIEAAPEDAIALSAVPMLIGPRMIPSIARTQSKRWKAATSFIFLYWHAISSDGSGLTKICGSVRRGLWWEQKVKVTPKAY
ncbi:hypothetical protein ATY75_21225 [Rhizobium sp. N122]|uniref:hypothetical protein n=1 Tax=Rhizobium sp. N122 TaxID=1764272 RepID=UPI000B5A5387|nr:hypothetical protein [Rhizobium sp. N122]OWV87883.1 hypothetical protein ATY75_21225 [Rhizobium sp. N122]